MRVDYLTEDELHNELAARNVIITRDMDLARKRKFLRDRLKAEGEGKNLDPFHIPSDPTKDLDICSKRCTELRCLLETEKDEQKKRVLQHRLIHYGAQIVRLLSASRGSPNLHGCMQGLLVEIVGELEQQFVSFGQEETIQRQTTEQTTVVPVDEDSPIDNRISTQQNQEDATPEQQAPGASTRMLNFSQSELDWIHALEARLVGLEQELFVRNAGVEVAVQTDPCEAFTPEVRWNPNSESQQDYNSFSHHFTQNPFHTASSYRNFPPVNRLDNHSNALSDPLPTTATFNHIPPLTTQNQTYTMPPVNTFSNSHTPQYSQPPQNPPPPHHAQPLRNPFSRAQYSIPFQPRHTLPVSKWNISKYSGDDQGLRLNEFLELVQALSLAEHVSNHELFESAVHLFTGSALKWYMTQRSTGRLMNWEHLVFELRQTYMHPDLDALIKMKIYQRRQQRQESFHEFYFEMEKLFRSMCVQIPDQEKVQILQQNMRVDYRRQMTFIPIFNLETLVAAGQKLDALNFLAYNKVFGTEKSVQAIIQPGANGRNQPKPNASLPQQQKRPSGSFKT